MATAKEQISAVIQNPNTSFEDVLFTALEIAAYRERFATYNPNNLNRVTKTQGDTNLVNYSVILETQIAPATTNDGSMVVQAIDYLVEPAAA